MKKILKRYWIVFALLASAGILLSFQNTNARCYDQAGEPVYCGPPCVYSDGPSPDTSCRRYCGDRLIQQNFGEECDPLTPGGSTPTCSNTCRNIFQQNHSICNASEACVQVAGPGTNQCASDADCLGTSNAWVDITITANTPEAGWNLICPSPGGPYSCNGVPGSGDYHFYPDAYTLNGAIAGVGSYGIDPVINTPNYTFDKIGAGSSANPAYRGPRPPATISFYWNLEYKPKITGPTVDLKCNGIDGPCTVLSGTNVTLSWTTANVTTCTASGGWSGAKGLSGSESRGPINAPVTFTLTCDGVSDSVLVSPGTPTTVDLKCNGSDGPCSVSAGGNVALQWTSTNADTCTASGGTWAGPRGITGSESQGPINGTYVYALSCTGASTAVDYVTVNVQGPRDATCASSTIPATMLPGETRAVTMAFFNSGTMPWTDPDFDVSQWPWPASNPSMIPQSFLALPAGTVNPGGTATYNFDLTAPVTPGVYSGAYRMLEQNVEWFGQTCGQSITVGSPTVLSDVTVQVPDYCAPGLLPGVFVSWTYSGSTPQTAYRIQIDDDPAFATPNFAMGKVMSSNNSIYASGKGSAGWGPAITWGNTYYARIRVYDGGDVASPWTNQTICIGTGCNGGVSWTTPSGAYPVVAFTSVPAKPVAGQPTQFTDATVCLGGGCQAWLWDFGDGTTDSVQNPAHTYALQGAFSVKLDVTDGSGNMCSITKALNANKALPFWREVLPW